MRISLTAFTCDGDVVYEYVVENERMKVEMWIPYMWIHLKIEKLQYHNSTELV